MTVKTFWPDFAPSQFFFENVLEYRNRSKFVRGPHLVYSTIWVKNIWRSEKKTHSLFSGPNNDYKYSWIFYP